MIVQELSMCTLLKSFPNRLLKKKKKRIGKLSACVPTAELKRVNETNCRSTQLRPALFKKGFMEK